MLEHGVENVVTNLDSHTVRRTAIHLEHRADGSGRGDDLKRHGHGPLGDAGDGAVGRDEQHVEWNQSVLHPHGDRPVLAKIEQHAGIGRHAGAIHQAAGLLFRCFRQFDIKGMGLAVRRLYGEMCLIDRIGQGRHGEQHEQKTQATDRTHDRRTFDWERVAPKLCRPATIGATPNRHVRPAGGMRGLAAALALLIALPSCAGREGAPWTSSLDRDHPLVGRIWLPAAGRYADTEELTRRLGEADIVLLGERHDNPDHHRLQAWALQRVIAAGKKPRLVFEMISPEQAGGLENYLKDHPGDVDGLEEALAWKASNWPDWSNYRPLFAQAIAAGLAIRPANLARATVRQIARGEAIPDDLRHFYGLDLPQDPVEFEAMATEIRDSHCGQLPERAIAPMVDVQRARDAVMAHALVDGNPANAVLIAGAGHTRTDRGVPARIAAMVQGRSVFSLAFIEVDGDWPGPDAYARTSDAARLPYDAVWFTPRASDDDPCAEMLNYMKRKQEMSGKKEN